MNRQARCRVALGRGKLCDAIADETGATKTGVLFRCLKKHTFSVSSQEVEWSGEVIERSVKKPVVPTRAADPETSKRAAQAFNPAKLSRNQAAVKKMFTVFGAMPDKWLVQKYHAATRDDASVYPKQSDSGIRTRRAELTTGKVLRDTGRTEKIGRSGHRVFELVA